MFGLCRGASGVRWNSKNIAYVKKQLFLRDKHDENGFLGFSSDDVFSCIATGDDGRAGARALALRHKAMTSARKARRAKHQKRGF